MIYKVVEVSYVKIHVYGFASISLHGEEYLTLIKQLDHKIDIEGFSAIVTDSSYFIK